MRILIANDDGYLAPGIAALVEACQGLGEIEALASGVRGSRHCSSAGTMAAGRRWSVNGGLGGKMDAKGCESRLSAYTCMLNSRRLSNSQELSS